MSSSTRPCALSLILKRSPFSDCFDNRVIIWSGMVSNKMFATASAVTLAGWDRLAAIVWRKLQDSPEDKGRHNSWGIEAGNSQSKKVNAWNKGNKHVHKHPKIRLHAMQCRSWLTCMCAHVRMCNRQLSATDNWCESSMDVGKKEPSHRISGRPSLPVMWQTMLCDETIFDLAHEEKAYPRQRKHISATRTTTHAVQCVS